ncbi:MAG: alpha,alpha-trehalase TreA [Saprospiraceae bacterium]
MQKIKILSATFLIVALGACQQANSPEKNAASAQKIAESTRGKSPDALYGPLFHDVQMREVFPDSKTFADCSPKFPPSRILEKYAAAKDERRFNLKNFVLENFEPPVAHSSGFKSDLAQSVEQHINSLWPVLTRQADTTGSGTLLPLPKNYIVPGGRFGEIYYWDSYFTMLGLEATGRRDLIENMVENFAYLIDTYGHIPNGNRAYYLSRSQPPFFSLMVRLLDDITPGDKKSPDAPLVKYLPQLEKEHAFWMEGGNTLTEDFTAHRRVVRVGFGQLLNRYWDDQPTPRPESYREDVRSAEQNTARPKEETYRNLKAAAESGWDFSSRWGTQNKDVSRLITVDILPVDLNCLIWNLEKTISDGYARKGDAAKMQHYGKLAYDRQKAITFYFYDKQMGWFQDFNWQDKGQTGNISLAGMFPVWLEIADKPQADACAKTLEAKFLRVGGLVCTPRFTGQQWDAPNGWAPLQWVAIDGLRSYGHNRLADEIKKRWLFLCDEFYKRTGKMLEKYNVESVGTESGGGEYPVQDGFGWTNGVTLKLLKE